MSFASWGAWIYRRAWWAIGGVSLLVLALASQLPRLELDTSSEGFLRSDDPIRETYREYRELFGREGVVFLAIRPPEVFDLPFLRKLRRFHDALEREVPTLEQITSLVNVRSLHGEGDELRVRPLSEEWPRDAEDLPGFARRTLAHPLYRNLLISADGRLTTIVLRPQTRSTPSPEMDASGDGRGRDLFLDPEQDAEFARAVRAVVDRFDAPDFPVLVAGTPILQVELKRAVQRDMARFAVLSLVAIAVLLLWLFRRASGAVLPLAIAGLSLVSMLGLMGATRTPIRLPTQILPSFLLAVGVCGSVHVLVLFFRGFDAGRSRERAISDALAHCGLPVVMTSVTTAGGLIAFTTAELAPIAEFGVFGPAGVMLSLLFTLVLLPALVAVIPLRRRSAAPQAPAALDRLLRGFGDFATRRPAVVVAAWSALGAVSLLGIPRIALSHDPLAWLPESHPFRVATLAIDRELEGTIALEVMVESDAPEGLEEPALLGALDALSADLQATQRAGIPVGKTLSLADVVKEINQALHGDDPAHYAVPASRELVAQELLLFEASGSSDLEQLADGQLRIGRFTIRVPWMDAVRYPPFIREVEASLAASLPAGTSLRTTGGTAVLAETIAAVITSLLRSYAVAFLVITPLMMLVIGSAWRGLLGMIPNVAPIVATLGLMGWAGIPLDAFTLLVGCIAIGLAVDDTLHFMYVFGRYRARGSDIPSAVARTLETTGRALLFTTLVLAAGFFAYGLSSMQNLRDFGLLIGLAIVLAFLADVLLSPALIALLWERR